jgi:hypothetical protein
MSSNPNTKMDVEIAADGHNTVRSQDTAPQMEKEKSEPQGQDDDHPGAHPSHTSPEVRRFRNDPTALTDL